MYTRYAKRRDELGLTDNAIALKAGVPQSTIYSWKQRAAEGKDCGISIKNLIKIADVLDVPVEYLVEGVKV